MKKFFALIGARNKEFYRDRSALIWTLLFPFIVLAGFTYGYSGRQDPLLRVAVLHSNASSVPALVEFQKTPGMAFTTTSDEPAAMRKLERYESDLVLSTGTSENSFTYSYNKDSDKGRLAERLLVDAFSRQPEPRAKLEVRAMTGTPIRYSDWLLPGLLAMNIMFGSMFGVGYVIVRYRKNGVLKRLRATPLSAFQFLVAQVFSRMMLMVVTSFMVVIGSMFLIGFRSHGSWFDLMIFLAVSSIAMISLGLMVAARLASEEVAEGVLNLMTWPMIFLSGIWFSLEGASQWVIFTAKLMPLTHIVDGLRTILIDGASLAQLMPQITVLLGLSALFIAVASLIFKWR